MEVLGQISREEFLKKYWQKKPLLIKGAFKDWENIISPDELAGLSLEQTIESRIVTQKKVRQAIILSRVHSKPSVLRP